MRIKEKAQKRQWGNVRASWFDRCCSSNKLINCMWLYCLSELRLAGDVVTCSIHVTWKVCRVYFTKLHTTSILVCTQVAIQGHTCSRLKDIGTGWRSRRQHGSASNYTQPGRTHLIWLVVFCFSWSQPKQIHWQLDCRLMWREKKRYNIKR